MRPVLERISLFFLFFQQNNSAGLQDLLTHFASCMLLCILIPQQNHKISCCLYLASYHAALHPNTTTKLWYQHAKLKIQKTAKDCEKSLQAQAFKKPVTAGSETAGSPAYLGGICVSFSQKLVQRLQRLTLLGGPSNNIFQERVLRCNQATTSSWHFCSESLPIKFNLTSVPLETVDSVTKSSIWRLLDLLHQTYTGY